MEFRRRFPKIKFGKFYVADGNVLIQDCSPGVNIQDNERINSLINEQLNSEGSLATFQIVDANEASKKLLQLLSRKRNKNSLVLFPGNGALSVKKYLSALDSEYANGVYIPVSRTMIDKGKFEVYVKIPDLPKGFSEILLIDDVVASGQTSTAIVKELAKKTGTLPPIDLACWLTLDNRDPYYSAGLPYFRSVFASLVVKGNNVSKPAINSLSCLLDQTGRYDRVKQEYTRRYLPNGEKIIEDIRNLVNKGGVL